MSPSFIRSNTFAVLVCYGSMACLAIAANLVPVYLTTFSETFGGPDGLTAEQLGRISAVVFAAMVIGILVSGPAADRWGGKSFVILGLILTMAGLGMLAAARSYGALLASAAVMGFGGGVLDMVLSPIVCALQPRHKTRALNWLHAFYCIGALGTIVAGAAALRLGIPWRAVALAICIVPAAMLAAFVPLRIPPLVHHEATRTGVRHLLAQPLFIGALVAITLCGATEQGMSQWLPAYAERGLGYSKAVSGFALAGFSIGMILGRMASGALAHRLEPTILLLAGCAGSAAAFAADCFLPVAPAALAACVLLGVTVSCLWPTTLSLAADRFPHGGASMFSLMAAAGNAGCIAMPWIVGIVGQHTTLRLGLATAGLCPLLLGVLVFQFSPKRTHDSA